MGQTIVQFFTQLFVLANATVALAMSLLSLVRQKEKSAQSCMATQDFEVSV
jgi:hypothetical protein